jgi:hypothetical protein
MDHECPENLMVIGSGFTVYCQSLKMAAKPHDSFDTDGATS